jgi:HicB family.
MRKVIRVSEDVHRELKASAARKGKTLSAYADELLRRALAAEVVKSE